MEGSSDRPKILYTRNRSKKKAVFHGAFEGGFSAGYYNSVGSKEGWAPSRSRKSQRMEDYMDDADFNEWGGPQGVQTQYDTAAGAGAGACSGVASRQTNTIGNALLRALGYRESTGQAYISVSTSHHPHGSNSNSNSKSNNNNDSDSDDRMSHVLRISLPLSAMVLPAVKLDASGIGHVVKREMSSRLCLASALEKDNEGDEIYKTGASKENYNFEIVDTDDDDSDDDRPSTLRSVQHNPTSSDANADILPGFLPTLTTHKQDQPTRWPGPNMPIHYHPQLHVYAQPNQQSYKHRLRPQKYANQLHSTPHSQTQPMAGTAFLSLKDSIKRRFTSSHQSTTTPPTTQNPQSKASSLTRSIHSFMPASLLCKRFSIPPPTPFHNTNTHTHHTNNDAKSEWAAGERAYFQQHIITTLQNAPKPLSQTDNTPLSKLKQSNWEWNDPTNALRHQDCQRPTIQQKRRIFDTQPPLVKDTAIPSPKHETTATIPSNPSQYHNYSIKGSSDTKSGSKKDDQLLANAQFVQNIYRQHYNNQKYNNQAYDDEPSNSSSSLSSSCSYEKNPKKHKRKKHKKKHKHKSKRLKKRKK